MQANYKIIITHLIISNVLQIVIPLLAFSFVPIYSNQNLLLIDSDKSFNSSLSEKLLLPFVNFDGLQYWYNHYQYEPSFAFILGYTKFVRFVQFYFHWLSDNINQQINQNHAILFLIIINKILFSASTFLLIKIGILLKFKPKQIETAILLYIYNPACIFYHSLYSESLYTFITWMALVFYIKRKNSYFNWLTYLVLFGFAVFIRSTGIFLSLIVGFPLIIKLIQFLFNQQFLQCIKTIRTGVYHLGVFIFPLMIYLYWSYKKLCVDNLNYKPQFCKQTIPNAYNYIQDKYWNVGLMKYYTFNNIIFISISLPTLIICCYGIYKHLKRQFWMGKTVLPDNKNLEQIKYTQIGLFLSFLVLFFISVLLSNVQSSTRFFSSHPFFYLMLSRISRQKVMVYCLTYYLFGSVMFGIGFPWT